MRGDSDADGRPSRAGARRWLRWVVVGLAVAALVLVAATGWAAWSMRGAQQHLEAARSHLLEARSAAAGYDVATVTTAVEAAQSESNQAAALAGSRIWGAAAAVPVVGATPDAARSLVLAADEAVGAASLVTASLEGVELESLRDDDGRLDLASIQRVGQAAESAQDGLAAARTHITDMPTAASGAWVLEPIEQARVELSDQLEELATASDAVARAGDVVPALFGADGPRRYFVAVQAPNETRGTGGLVGTWAVLEADDGLITIADVGSNGDMPTLDAMPESLGDDYLARYGQDPRLFVNMNVSPDFPAASTLWLESWRAKTGQELDGAIGIDVTAIGDLLTATGVTLTAPDGLTLTGEQFADFALAGIYEKFPTGADSAARKDYQEALARQALVGVLAAGDPKALARSLVGAVDERRVALWVDDREVQAEISGTDLAHSLTPAQPHTVEPVLINIGWSKLDTYIDREFDYEVGRCMDANGDVRSSLTMRFTSDLPEGVDLPEYVVGAVEVGPDGPINKLILQTHLSPGAEVLEVEVDGESSQYWEFVEGGRPAVGYILDLAPREPREVRILFREPGDGGSGVVEVQPMARDAAVSVEDRAC